jgi:hypothetical protein
MVCGGDCTPLQNCLVCQDEKGLSVDDLRRSHEHGVLVYALSVKISFTYSHLMSSILTSRSIKASPDMTALIFGDQKTIIPCHKALLGFFSQFFDSALYGSFSEAAQAEVCLPEEELEQVQDLVAWLYSGQSRAGLAIQDEISLFRAGERKEWTGNEPLPEDEFKSRKFAASIWILADKIMCPRLVNYVMEYMLYDFSTFIYCSFDTEYAFSISMPGSKLRVLYQDLIATDGPLRKDRLKETKVLLNMKIGYHY